jgi:hypothetical protein
MHCTCMACCWYCSHFRVIVSDGAKLIVHTQALHFSLRCSSPANVWRAMFSVRLLKWVPLSKLCYFVRASVCSWKVPLGGASRNYSWRHGFILKLGHVLAPPYYCRDSRPVPLAVTVSHHLPRPSPLFSRDHVVGMHCYTNQNLSIPCRA